MKPNVKQIKIKQTVREDCTHIVAMTAILCNSKSFLEVSRIVTVDDKTKDEKPQRFESRKNHAIEGLWAMAVVRFYAAMDRCPRATSPKAKKKCKHVNCEVVTKWLQAVPAPTAQNYQRLKELRNEYIAHRGDAKSPSTIDPIVPGPLPEDLDATYLLFIEHLLGSAPKVIYHPVQNDFHDLDELIESALDFLYQEIEDRTGIGTRGDFNTVYAFSEEKEKT